MFCVHCGRKLEEGARFCANCGRAVNACDQQGPQPSWAPPAGYGAAPPSASYGGQQAYESDEEDARHNTGMAVLAYFGILVLIPLLAAPNSRFARYHANQGLVLWIAGLVSLILIYFLYFIAMADYTGSFLMFAALICFAIGIGELILTLIGIVNACKGVMKPLPLIGGFQILK